MKPEVLFPKHNKGTHYPELLFPKQNKSTHYPSVLFPKENNCVLLQDKNFWDNSIVQNNYSMKY
jgi:hypothetical protein